MGKVRMVQRILWASLLIAVSAVVVEELGAQEDVLSCSGVHVSHPVVSPDGRQVAFLSDESGGYELYTYDVPARTISRLTDNDSFEGSVSWAPDSRQFVFWAQFDGDEDFEGYRFDMATGSYEQVVRNPGNDFDLDWSPDGRRLVFQSERDGNREIYLMDLPTGEVRRLTTNEIEDLTPSWSPDGERIAFSSARSGLRQIYVMDLSDGSVSVVPGQPAAANYFPVWHPEGRRMLVTSGVDDGYSLHLLSLESAEITLIAQNVSSGPGSWSFVPGEVLFSQVVGEGSEIRSWSPERGTQLLVDCRDLRSRSRAG